MKQHYYLLIVENKLENLTLEYLSMINNLNLMMMGLFLIL